MKKFVFSASLFLFSAVLFAQSDVQPNVIKINPLGAFIGTANLGFEHALNEQSSVVILPSFGFIKSGDLKYTDYGLGAEYRFYFTGTAPRGTYAAPGIAGLFGTVKEDSHYYDTNSSSKTNISGFSAKAIIGHQWVWNSSFVLDLNGGIQYVAFKFKDKTGDFANQDALSGVLPTLSVSIGYNF